MKPHEIAERMVAKGGGILAADESVGTCDKRFDSVGIEKTEENRRDYRELLFSAPGLNESIRAVILCDETFYQRSKEGILFPEVLQNLDILPGIKVDKGTWDLANFPGEKHTEGLDGLRGRLSAYAKAGAKFAKWRAVITIGKAGVPTDTCLRVNAGELAQYAALCQEAGLAAIVEPEVLMDGYHSIERCRDVSVRTLNIVFEELKNHRVDLKGIVLKPSMVIAGKDCPTQASSGEIADMTVETLKKCVPPEVPGIAFLSGGQSELQATKNLNAINTRSGDAPWRLSFSYGRALQSSALKAFASGDKEKARRELTHRAKMNGLASDGLYKSEEEI